MTISELNSKVNLILIKKFALQECRTLIKILFEDILSINAVQLITSPDKEINSLDCETMIAATDRLLTNEPIQYITGKAYFLDHIYKVNSSVLIPRPETEELVLKIIEENSQVNNNISILDIGTGSGCIAISLQKRLNSTVFAADISKDALSTAQKNAKEINADVHFINLDILNYNDELKEQKFDIIVSNPPYVLESEKELMEDNVLKYEPHTALFVEDNDPLLFYKKIAIFAKAKLKKNGKLYFEINESQKENTKKLLKDLSFSEIKAEKDLFEKERIVSAILL